MALNRVIEVLSTVRLRRLVYQFNEVDDCQPVRWYDGDGINSKRD